MADKTIGELDAVKESPISGLPAILELYDNTLIPVEQQGDAMRMTGKQFREFGEKTSAEYVQIAVDAAEKAEEMRNSIEIDYDALNEAVESATESATSANDSKNIAVQKAQAASESESQAQHFAGVAEAEAERATVPAVAGVYNIILTDRATQKKYALLIENERLTVLGVSDEFQATNFTLIDSTSGISYRLIVEDGRIEIEEAG